MNNQWVIPVTLVMLTGNANAHIPNVLPHDTSASYAVGLPTTIEKSVAFYAGFDCAGDVDTYGFTLGSDAFETSNQLTDLNGTTRDLVVVAPNGKPGRLLHIGSLVPACQAYATVLPTVAVVGPAQDSLRPYDGAVALPSGIEIKTGQGVMFLQNSTQGEVWYEKFSYKSYFDQNDTDIILTEQGEYRIYVWNSNSSVGDYVLEAGNIEVFGFQEIMQTLFWVTHIIYDGEISSRECRSQLQDLDGRNPSLGQIITDYQKMFAK